jgi:hypothetical protein
LCDGPRRDWDCGAALNESIRQRIPMILSTLFSKGRPMLANEVIDVDDA